MIWNDTIAQDVLIVASGVRSAASRDTLACWLLALALCISTIGGICWLLRTKGGLSLAEVRDNDQAARAVEVDLGAMKKVVFLTTAFGAGIAGGLIFLQKRRTSPDAIFSATDCTAYVMFIVVIFGTGTIESPMIRVIVFCLLQSFFADHGAICLMAVGAIGIVIMLFVPREVWGLFSDKTGIHLFPICRRLAGGRLANPKE
jgi:branched-chain amino acid transport system permease protein